MTDPLSTLAGLAEAPEDATPLSAVLVVEYLDTEGEPAVGMSLFGNSTATAALGLLSWASWDLATNYFGERD